MPITHREPLLSELPIEFPPTVGDDTDGAEVRFSGRVRVIEGARRILGIRYTAYVPMVEAVFDAIGRGAEREFGLHTVVVRHRTGFVPVGETSILIVVATPHGGEAFDLCRYYLRRIKEEAPIWKQPLFA